MGHWQDIAKVARSHYAAALAQSEGETSATALLAAAEQITGIGREPVPEGDPLLYGGEATLDVENSVIWYNQDIDHQLAVFYLAHEYAHFWLGGEHAACTRSEINTEDLEEPVPLGVRRVEGYGPDERREREANVFAREFLLPTEILREWYLAEGLDATAIAARTGVPEGMVLHQLSRALLTPDIPDEVIAESPTETTPKLDPSQQAAAHIEHGPLLLEAGPGTGKTRTLIGRIHFLLDKGVPASSILALTFSNKAAEEMRSRIARVSPDAAQQIWMGTFHAFGLELLRKFGTRLGLPPKPDVIDPVEALFLLERFLPELQLDHYQNLYEPTTYLRNILAAVSRAKDELVGPEEYAKLAEQQLARATTDKEAESAEKAREVARVYAFYQEHLEREGFLDFGDLIYRSVHLLQMHSDVRSWVQETYAHVLVDEYQDVNRASGVLLREIAGTGEGLWVVGDVRQAIYRFRGAAPRNMRLFAKDFPGTELSALERNYRSQPAVLEVFTKLAPQMSAAQNTSFTPWQPDRSDSGGKVMMEIAEDAPGEIVGLAREIEHQRAAGVRYSDQAVLCRSHTGLARIAAGLEQAGVPVLYLSDIFERPEVRDLLSLLELACEGDGRGLVRVARFEEYQVPLADVLTLLELAKKQDVPFPRALKLAQDADTISQQGKEALALLDAHIEGLCYGRNAWGMLVRYLFVRSSYVRRLLEDDSVAGEQRRLAVYQFLQFAHEQRENQTEGSEDPKRTFLRYVRRLEMFGEEKQFRQVPEWASGLDAVRLLTVHASKGLEFSVVYLPLLGRGMFPASRRGQPCPPPEGMLPAGEEDGHDEEEECLFFVGLSRAQDTLCLSRARRYGKRNSNPSTLLTSISSHLPNPPDGEVTWDGGGSMAEAVTSEATPSLPQRIFTVQQLDVYMKCPRKYYYEFVLGLGGRREDSAYVQFHRCVYSLLLWLQGERAHGRCVDEETSQSRLAEIWESMGPTGHPYEDIYRENAKAMVTRAVERSASMPADNGRTEWEVALPHGRIRFTPDYVELLEGEAETIPLVQRLRTGRPGKSEQDDPIYALYQRGAEQAYPGLKARVERLYLSTGQTEDAGLGTRSTKTRLDKYDSAITGIQRGEFSPKPDDHVCPRCPHYFICPAAEDA